MRFNNLPEPRVMLSSRDSGNWSDLTGAGIIGPPSADRLQEAMEKAWAECKSTPTSALILCDDKVWRYVTLGEPFEPAMKPQRDMLTWRDRRAHLERGRGRRR